MFQSIWQDNIFESGVQKLREEVTYYAGLLGAVQE